MSSTDEDVPSTSTPDPSANLYKKLKLDGTIDPKPLTKADFELVNEFIKETFPSATRVQRELEQTLKRTFILGRSKGGSKNASFLQEVPKKPSNISKNRAMKRRFQRMLPKHLNYGDYLELNSLWKEYIKHLLKDDKSVQDIQNKLNRVDLHGALIKVTSSHSKCYEGLQGIVLQETKNTFVVVTELNVTKTLPKPESTFTVALDCPYGTMSIVGNSFLTRPAERVSKKIKSFLEFTGRKVYKSKLKYSTLD